MAIDITALSTMLGNLDFKEAFPILKVFVIYIIGLLVYSIFIFKFYRFVAKRDIFELNLRKYSTSEVSWIKQIGSAFFYVLEYLIIFPLFTLLWSGVLFVFLALLAKNQTVETMLLVAMAIVAIVRATAYYNEELSKDLAKILPFTLLGFFLLDSSYFSLSQSLSVIQSLPGLLSNIVYYFIFIVILEFVLRMLFGLFRLFVPGDEDEEASVYKKKK